MYTLNGIGTTLYGHTHHEDLQGKARELAEKQGFNPRTYQAVKWFVIFFVPIVPLGVYRVMDVPGQSFSATRQHFRMVPAPWDVRQILRHYAISAFVLAIFAGIVAGIASIGRGCTSDTDCKVGTVCRNGLFGRTCESRR